MYRIPCLILVVYAALPFSRFHVLSVLSAPTDKASLPDGCMAIDLTPPLYERN